MLQCYVNVECVSVAAHCNCKYVSNVQRTLLLQKIT